MNQEQNGVGKATVDNVRRNLSSFFKWLEDENYIFKSSLRGIHKIKTTITVRETYADEELEKLRKSYRQWMLCGRSKKSKSTLRSRRYGWARKVSSKMSM